MPAGPARGSLRQALRRVSVRSSAPAATSARAAAACNGDVTEGRRVVSQVDTLQRDAPIDPDTRLAQVLHDSLDPARGGDGCDSGTDDGD